jgi:Ca2+/Na+ antiporter
LGTATDDESESGLESSGTQRLDGNTFQLGGRTSHPDLRQRYQRHYRTSLGPASANLQPSGNIRVSTSSANQHQHHLNSPHRKYMDGTPQMGAGPSGTGSHSGMGHGHQEGHADGHHHAQGAGGHASGGHGGHGGHDNPNWSAGKSAFVLMVATVLFSLIAEVLIDSVDFVIDTGSKKESFGGGFEGEQSTDAKFVLDEKILGLTLFALVPTVTEFCKYFFSHDTDLWLIHCLFV